MSLSGAAGPGSSRQTDAAGGYRFSALPRGVYELEFRRQGFAPVSLRSLVVAEGTTAIENVTLRAASEYSVAVSVDSGTTSMMTNQSRVATSTPEARPGDEAVAEDTTVTTQADLASAISASVDPVIAGTGMSYTVTVTNGGPSVARFVEVTDTLPAGVTFGSTRGCAEDPDGHPVCTLGTIAPGDSARYTIAVQVGSRTLGTLVNQVSVNSQTVEIAPGDESARVEVAVDTRADLAMTRSVAPDPVVAGTRLVYTVTVANKGPSDARAVVVEDALPAGASLEATAGCAEDPAAIPNCSLGAIPAGGSRRYTVAVVVAAAASGVLTDRASVGSATAEASPGDESTSVTAAVTTRADLATKVDTPDSVIAGTQVSYAITVTNNGPSDAQGVGITVNLPPVARLESTNGCDEDPRGAPTCSLGTIAAGASRQVTVVAAVDSAALGGMQAQLGVRSETPEARPGDESLARDTAVGARADLVITTRDSVDPVIAGRPLTYTVTVVNNGPSDARDVVVNGELPATVSFQATDGCAEDDQPGGGLEACALGNIPAGSSKSFTISVLVDPDATGVITNRADVTSSTIEARPGDETVPPPASIRGRASEPAAAVQRWAAAWSGRRIDDYLAFYSQRFQPPDEMSRDDWEAYRRSRIQSKRRIDVRLSRIEDEVLGPDRARVVFDQSYSSDDYSDTVRKTLELVKEGDRWLIVEERSEG